MHPSNLLEVLLSRSSVLLPPPFAVIYSRRLQDPDHKTAGKNQYSWISAINQALNFTQEVMSWDSFRSSQKRTSWLGAISTIWEASHNSGCLLFSFTHRHPSTCLFSLKSFQLFLPLKLTSRESSRDFFLQSRCKSWFLFPLWRMYRAGWGPSIPQLALGTDMWFFPPWHTFPKASRFRAGILQQHNSLTPGWESTFQELGASTGTTWLHVTAFWGEKSPSIHASSRVGTTVIPDISEKPCWVLEEKKQEFQLSTAFSSLWHLRMEGPYPHRWPQAVTISSYSHDQVFAGSQPQGLPRVRQSWETDKKTLTAHIQDWHTTY